MRKINPITPLKIVENSKVNFGIFGSPFRQNNLIEANAYGKNIPSWFNYFRLKEWQAFQMGNEQFFILVAVYNAKNLGVNQFFIYDKYTKTKYAYEKLVPYPQTKVAQTLFGGISEINAKNFQIKITSDFETGTLQLHVEIRKFKQLPDVFVDFDMNFSQNKTKSLCVSLPFAKNRGMYSFKQMMPMSGQMKLGNTLFEFHEKESFAIFDDHKGYYPYAMKYDWVTSAHFSENGNIVGFNLTHNQALQPEENNENALWDGEKLFLLPHVTFQRPDGVMNKWIIKDSKGIVDLRFYPETDNVMKINIGILRSDYHGPYGYFEGTIKLENKTYSFDRVFGMGEKKQIWA